MDCQRQVAGGQTPEQIVQDVDRLNGGGRVVDGGRKRALGDVDQLADREGQALPTGAPPH